MKSFKEKISKKIYSLLLTKNYIYRNSSVTYPKNSSVHGNHFNGKIIIGENSKILRTECYGEIEIGNNSALNGPNLNIYSGQGKVTIGNFCSIARNVSIHLEGHNYKKITSYQIFKNLFHLDNNSEVINKGDVIIGNDVWIGANTMIYGKVNIGDGAVIGSNSFVNQDVPAYAIVVGSPAKIIKYRFEKEIITELQKLRWWNWDREKILKNKFLFVNELKIEDLKQII